MTTARLGAPGSRLATFRLAAGSGLFTPPLPPAISTVRSPPWRYILAKPDDGDEVGEIWQAGDRKISRPLAGGAGAGSVGMRVDLDNPMVPKMLGTGPVERLELLLKAYRGDELMFCGELYSAEAASDGQQETFALSALGPLTTRIQTRYLGGGVAGTVPVPYGDGTPLAQKDLGVIIANSLAALNSGYYTGIDLGPTQEPSSDGYVEKLYWKRIGELWMELSEALGGPDVSIDPIEPVATIDGIQIAELNIHAAKGSQQPTAIFEYGMGKRNVASWRQPFDTAGMANHVSHLASGFPDSIEAGQPPVVEAINAATFDRRLRSDVVSTDLSPTTLRQMLVDEHARIRGYPRETIFFTPAANCDVQYAEHYREGDLVEARAASRSGLVLFDALFRVYGVEFTLDNLGLETVELALINEATQL